MYDRNTTGWETQDGKKIIIKDLTTPHLVNILNWIKTNPKTYSSTLMSFMEEEATFRSLSEFTQNKPIPFKKEDGWYDVRNISKIDLYKSLFYKHKARAIYHTKTQYHRTVLRVKSLYYKLKIKG